MEQELRGLKEKQKNYSGEESWNSKYWYYSFSGKIDVLRDLLFIKNVKKKHVEALRQEVQENYKNIRRIKKSERDTYQTLEGIYFEAKLDIIENWIVPELFTK